MLRSQPPIVLAALLAAGLFATADKVLADANSEFNEPDNYLIADQFNNRVIEVDADGKVI